MKKRILLIILAFLCLGAAACAVWAFADAHREESALAETIEPTAIIETHYYSEEAILEVFHDNYDRFTEVASYLENEPGNFSCQKTTEGIEIRPYMDINDYEIGGLILYFFDDLNARFIDENDDDDIEFCMRIGYADEGVLYVKEGYPAPEEIDSTDVKIEKIQDGWYYCFYRLID